MRIQDELQTTWQSQRGSRTNRVALCFLSFCISFHLSQMSEALSDIDTESGGRDRGRRARDKCVGRLTGLSAKRLRNALSRIIKRNLERVVCIYMAPSRLLFKIWCVETRWLRAAFVLRQIKQVPAESQLGVSAA